MNDMTIWVSILLDLIVVGLLALGITRGYLKGFIKTAYHLVSWVLSLFLTHLFYPYTVKLLKVTRLSQLISAFFGKILAVPTDAADGAINTISSLKIPEILKDRLIENNNYEVYDILGVKTLSEYVNAYLTNMVINVLAILLTFLIVLLLIKIVALLLEIVDHLPVIHTLNHALGLILGCANGVIYVWVFCLLITFFGAMEKLSILYPAVSRSLLTNLFYNHNIMLDSVLKIFGA